MDTSYEFAEQQLRVAVVGGGLVGSLEAVLLGKRGFEVQLFEQRSDPRKISGSLSGTHAAASETTATNTPSIPTSTSRGRSINLALSTRGIAALSAAGVSLKDLSLLPMKHRVIHKEDADIGRTTNIIPYSSLGLSINSVDRNLINCCLLSAIDAFSNISIFFNHSLVSIDFHSNTLYFKLPDNSIRNYSVDLIIGADGAYSRVRRELMRATNLNYSQVYIDHAYIELSIPPLNNNYQLDHNGLHIWPRNTFMMIALPNTDMSFTVTLFMPWTKFDAIKTEKDLITFFKATFPDALPLIGEELLIHDYFKNPKSSLISIKCKPYHYKSNCVIIGDAAHAMVPFYGQGMNCGFEDCLVLDEILTKHLGKTADSKPTPEILAAVLSEYSKTRNEDAEAMCDLAMCICI